MPSTATIWFVAVLAYALFFTWYTGLAGPLSPEEIETYLERIEESGDVCFFVVAVERSETALGMMRASSREKVTVCSEFTGLLSTPSRIVEATCAVWGSGRH